MSDNESKPKEHVVLLEPPKEEGSEAMLVSSDGRVEFGRLGGAKEGQDLRGMDMVQLAPHRNSPVVWNVKDRMSFRSEEEGSKGPAKVNSKAFRDNYERIFGGDDDALPN
jgi:hypothetical protein